MNTQDKPIKSLAEVTAGGRYVELEDGTIVPAGDDHAVVQQADAGPGAAVGAASGEPPAPAEGGQWPHLQA